MKKLVFLFLLISSACAGQTYIQSNTWSEYDNSQQQIKKTNEEVSFLFEDHTIRVKNSKEVKEYVWDDKSESGGVTTYIIKSPTLIMVMVTDIMVIMKADSAYATVYNISKKL